MLTQIVIVHSVENAPCSVGTFQNGDSVLANEFSLIVDDGQILLVADLQILNPEEFVLFDVVVDLVIVSVRCHHEY